MYLLKYLNLKFDEGKVGSWFFGKICVLMEYLVLMDSFFVDLFFYFFEDF